MKVAVFSTYKFDSPSLIKENEKHKHKLTLIEVPLTQENIELAKGHDVVSCLTNDDLSSKTLITLKEYGVKLIAIRAAGFDNVDVKAANKLGIKVCRVPAYSPHAIAEFAVGLLLTLNRKIHLAYRDVQMHDFTVCDKSGFDLYGKTVGIIGVGKIGSIFAKIMLGFGCKVLAYDLQTNQDCIDMGVEYVSIDELFKNSDIISLHCQLCSATHHLVGDRDIKLMKKGVFIINTSRGAVIDTKAIINGIKSGKIGGLGCDVYEREKPLFFNDLSCENVLDEDFLFLNAQPNVLITSHQAFLTEEALVSRAKTTLQNITSFAKKSGKIYYVK